VISRRNGKPAGARVAIIGCGFSGIAAAIALQRRGIHDYVIFEASDGVGGTWWSSRYPGAEVDLESHVYSFSYAPADWTRTHAGRHELQRYLQRVADTHGVTPKVRFGERVEKVEWLDASANHLVRTSSGKDHGLFTAVISAVGFLNIPIIPPFAHGDTGFRGMVCHTSRWPDGLDLAGKTVGIVGTGSSGVQVAPEAAKVAAAVKIFQREPNWIVPKGARDFTPLERWFNRRRAVNALRRWKLFWRYDLRQVLGRHVIEGTRVHRRRATLARRHIERALANRADLRALVTPRHVFEGKRPVLGDNFYPMLRRPNVTLVPHAVKELTTTGVLDSQGQTHNLDVVVLATGFDASNYLGNVEVVGDGGVELHDRWRGEPEAFLGMMVPGFPNFFMMYGPNTNSVPLVSFYEAQARFAAGLIGRMAKNGWLRVEVKERAHRLFNSWLQMRLHKTVWSQAESYFRAGTGGKVVSQWPFSASGYIVALVLGARIGVRFADRRRVTADVALQRQAIPGLVESDEASAARLAART
jgi:cation diffusion facilitator CzcD-associated flavoprotein CzcO